MKTTFFAQQAIRLSLIVIIIATSLFTPKAGALAKPSASFTNCAAQTQIPEIECEALVALYTSTSGANWAGNNGWLETDTPCTWFGVTCENGTNVTDLYFKENNLVGTLPIQLGNLTSLKTLGISSSRLTGTIPAEIGNLTNLTSLVIIENKLSGPIPSQLGNLTQLTTLWLSRNRLWGPIPTQLGNLTGLIELDLSWNNLTGSIPTEFGNLTQLTTLSLGNNLLDGSIPTGLGNLTQLHWLDLAQNELTGSIPSQLGNLVELTNLNLSENLLTNPIPTELGNLTKLFTLNLSQNQLTGSIPPGIGNFTRVMLLYLNNNQLTGAIPSEIGQMTEIFEFDLSNNQLSGRIPPEIGSLPEIYTLKLENNNLTGQFPTTITQLTQLSTLTFDCELFSTNASVISFINNINPYWQDSICLPKVTLQSIATQDGYILESAENSNAGGTLNATGAAFNIGDNFEKKQFRSLVSFNTGASLPDTAVITRVTLKVKENKIVGEKPFAILQDIVIDIKKGFYGASALQLGDFQEPADKSYATKTSETKDNWYVFDLTPARTYINKLSDGNGLTQIRLRFKLDDNNDAIANYISLYSGNAASDKRPQLIIQYYVP